VALSRERESVRLLSFARTFGETAALRLGIERSRGDVILTLPAYFQVQAEGVAGLLDALQAGADMVVASRSPRVDSWLNRLQSRAFHAIVGGLSDRRFHDMACGVRLIRRPVAEALPLYGDLHRFLPALALREGYRVDEVPVPQHPNDARTRVYGRACTSAACSTSPRSSSWPSSPRSRSGSSAWWGRFLRSGRGDQSGAAGERLTGRGIADRPLLLLASC
jgi:Glycosyltransferases involved in cell wall biogenesis